MDLIVDALKNLYVAMGGSADDVSDITLNAKMIDAIAVLAGSVLKAELPDNPTANGTYLLQAVKSNSGTVLSWVTKE